MQAFEAHGYYLLHNHPSGRAQPSAADRGMTAVVAATVPGFREHVVIDHDEYARIAFATEEAQLIPGDKLDFERRQAIPGIAGKIIRIPSRALIAEDEFFKGVAFHMELADLAMHEAIRANPRDPMGEFHRIMGTIDQRRDLLERARQAALRATFTTPLGPIMGRLSHALNKACASPVPCRARLYCVPVTLASSSLDYCTTS